MKSLGPEFCFNRSWDLRRLFCLTLSIPAMQQAMVRKLQASCWTGTQRSNKGNIQQRGWPLALQTQSTNDSLPSFQRVGQQLLLALPLFFFTKCELEPASDRKVVCFRVLSYVEGATLTDSLRFHQGFEHSMSDIQCPDASCLRNAGLILIDLRFSDL